VTLHIGIGPVDLGEPEAFLIAAGVVVAITAGMIADARRRRGLAGRLGELPQMKRMMASVSPRRRQIKSIATVVALIGVAIAVGRPQKSGKSLVETRGLDIVFAMDVSKSMLVRDVPPNRLGQARALAAALLGSDDPRRARSTDGELPGDRIAAVVFAGAAAHFPLTDDHAVTLDFLDDIGPADLSPGSDVAEAIRVSRCLLRQDLYDQLGCAGTMGRRGRGGDPLPGEKPDPADVRDEEETEVEKEERGKVIVIFTDGGDVEEAQAAADEIEICRQLGISVFLIGFGTEQGGEVWDVDSDGTPRSVKRDQNGNPIISRRDDASLRGLARAAGSEGRYMIAPETGGQIDTAPIVKALSNVKRGRTEKRIKKPRDIYHWFLFPAFMLLVIEALIATRKRVVHPEEP
jgi:Ca-activated chloride channel family protein